jgi:hypothetical protein
VVISASGCVPRLVTALRCTLDIVDLMLRQVCVRVGATFTIHAGQLHGPRENGSDEMT